MISQGLLKVLKLAIGGADVVAPPGGRPGKWVIGITTAKSAPPIRRDLERAVLHIERVQWIGEGE